MKVIKQPLKYCISNKLNILLGKFWGKEEMGMGSGSIGEK
jgi:hypothetical protein